MISEADKADGGSRSRRERDGRRSEIRLPVRLLGTVTADGEEPVSAYVADLSRGGACCRLPKPPRVGSAVELRLEGLGVPAIVCWVGAGLCGLRFTRELRATDILIQSGKSRAVHQDRPEGSRLFASASGHSRQAS